MRIIVLSIAFALLAACGGSQPPIGAPRVMQSRLDVTPDRTGRRTLLYVSTLSSDTYVYTYRKGKLRSILTTLFNTNGLCSDARGDVFLSSATIYEYHHGQDVPVAELSNPFGAPLACSVDPITGKLAVVSGRGLAIYKPMTRYRWRLPKLYTPSTTLAGGGYDAMGNLFVDGEVNSSQLFLAELPKGSKTFENIMPDVSITIPGTVQWDGQYLAVGDEHNSLIHRFAISGSAATQVGSLTLSGASNIGQFWIQHNTVIGPDISNNAVGFWHYPGGGTAVKSIPVDEPYGATISR